VAAYYGWFMRHLDVTTAFLYGDLAELVYVERPPGYSIAGQEDKVCLLLKALYGLKQAPRAWHAKIDTFLKAHGLLQSAADPNLYYFKDSNNQWVFLMLYVDDLLITGNATSKINWLIDQLLGRFEMTDLGRVQ
jgi:hypothetical protein